MEPRIGDAERDVATARLSDHFAAGRLDHEEYDERLDAIWSARTRSDLDQLFWDLPRSMAPVTPSRQPVRHESDRGWGIAFAMIMVGVVLLAVAAHVPWWVWLVAIVVLMKRPWARHRASPRVRH